MGRFYAKPDPAAAPFVSVGSLVDESTTVGMEDPGYADARNIFLQWTSRLTGLPVDEQRQADAPVDAQECRHDLAADVGDAGVDGLDVCLDRG